jgi:hypothetical protein
MFEVVHGERFQDKVELSAFETSNTNVPAGVVMNLEIVHPEGDADEGLTSRKEHRREQLTFTHEEPAPAEEIFADVSLRIGHSGRPYFSTVAGEHKQLSADDRELSIDRACERPLPFQLLRTPLIVVIEEGDPLSARILYAHVAGARTASARGLNYEAHTRISN